MCRVTRRASGSGHGNGRTRLIRSRGKQEKMVTENHRGPLMNPDRTRELWLARYYNRIIRDSFLHPCTFRTRSRLFSPVLNNQLRCPPLEEPEHQGPSLMTPPPFTPNHRAPPMRRATGQWVKPWSIPWRDETLLWWDFGSNPRSSKQGSHADGSSLHSLILTIIELIRNLQLQVPADTTALMVNIGWRDGDLSHGRDGRERVKPGGKWKVTGACHLSSHQPALKSIQFRLLVQTDQYWDSSFEHVNFQSLYALG